MKNKIFVSPEFRDYIEGLQYEKNSRLNLLNFMIMQNMKRDSEFEKIHNEYTEFYIKFELAKKKLEQLYLAPLGINPRGWRLDFKSMEVLINE